MTAYDDLLHARQQLTHQIQQIVIRQVPAHDIVSAIEVLIDAKIRLHLGTGGSGFNRDALKP